RGERPPRRVPADLPDDHPRQHAGRHHRRHEATHLPSPPQTDVPLRTGDGVEWGGDAEVRTRRFIRRGALMTEPRKRRKISLEVQMMSDLESDAPCIETLEWLKSEAPPDVFQATLRLILNRDGYDCDPETVDWARSQLSDSNP